MVNPNIDEMSMMTYLSQYPNAKLKPGAPLRPRTNRNRRVNEKNSLFDYVSYRITLRRKIKIIDYKLYLII